MFTFEIIMYPRALIRGNYLQLFRLNFFGIDFPSHTWSWSQFLTFCGQYNITRGKTKSQSVRSTSQLSHPHNIPPSHLDKIPPYRTSPSLTLHFSVIVSQSLPPPLYLLGIVVVIVVIVVFVVVVYSGDIMVRIHPGRWYVKTLPSLSLLPTSEGQLGE